MKTWLPPRVSPPRYADITPREADVLTGICHGLTNRAIGKRLYITENTVKTISKRLYAVMGARDRTHAAALAMSGQVLLRVKDGDRRTAA